MLGTAPDSVEWDDCFPWPDAIVPIPAPAPDVVQLIRPLDRDPERLDGARAAAVTTFLRRHDWAHRWGELLPSPGWTHARASRGACNAWRHGSTGGRPLSGTEWQVDWVPSFGQRRACSALRRPQA